MIPRTFHRIWVGGPEPEWLRRLGDTWAAQHPDWRIVQWGDGNVATLFPLRNQTVFDRAEELCPDHVGQLRADVLRYEILARHGGVYVDADFEALRPIDGLLDGVGCFAARQDVRWINNAILGCTPAHPAMRMLVDRLAGHVRRHRGAAPRVISGPRYLTRVLAGRRDVTVFPARLFYPYRWNELDHRPGEDWNGAYAVHHWRNQRRERGRLAEVE